MTVKTMLPPPPRPPKAAYHLRGCAIGREVIPALDDANRAWLHEALDDEAWPSSVIARHLSAALERQVGAYTVTRHRRRECTCGGEA